MYQQPLPQQTTIVVGNNAARSNPDRPPANNNNSNHTDDNHDNTFTKDLKEASAQDRMGFVKKVYSILFVQLAITAGFTSFAITESTVYNWLYDYRNQWLFWTLFPILIITEIAMICCRKVARTVPLNYIMLLIFTLCETYMVAWITISYTVYYDLAEDQYVVGNYDTVIMALAMTVGIVLAVTGYACTTKADFTRKMGIIWILGMAFFMFCLFTCFFYN